ncbi:MAG: carboxypeptidase-like regulatory domain-containing protein [Gemmatimonadota bacterium]
MIELRLGRLATRTVEAYRVGDEALIPLGQFFDMAGARATISPSGRVDATLQPGNVPLVIDAMTDVATFGRRRVTVPAGLKRLVNGELFYPATRLGELLDAPMYVDWTELEVVMRDPGPLPVAQALRRRAARIALAAENSPHSPGIRLPAERRQWDGFVVDYTLLSPSSSPIGGSSYSVQAGADLLNGSLELGASSIGPADAGDVRVDASWLGVWRNNRIVRQLRLGDGFGTGPRPRSIRGVSVTNAPFVRPSLIGSIPYAGRLPAGWGVEAYRAGQLIAFDSTDATGDFAIQLPVLYGENPVEFIAYGPYGETRVFARTYRVASALLPAHRLEYGASGGQCRFLACSASANTDIRYGISRRWTVQGGAERFWRDTLGDLFHPYAGVTGSVTNAITLQADAVANGFVHSGIFYEPSLDMRLTGEYTRYDTSSVQPIITLPGRRTLWQIGGFYRPVREKDFFYFEAAAERALTGDRTTDRARIGVSLQAGPVRVLPYARFERDASPGGPATRRSFAGFSTTVLPRQSWGRLLGSAFMRGTFEMEDLSRVSLASFALARSVAQRVRLELGVSWIRGFSGPVYTAGLSSYLTSLRSYTTATAQRGAPAAFSQLVQGSVLYDRAHRRMQLAPGPSLQRAGITGRVFMDANGNGRFDPGEDGLRNVRVQIGSNSAISDSAGGYRVWDLVPFEPLAVTVDSMSFESPLWVASYPSVGVVAGPNRYTLVDIPIVQGAVIEGRVVRPLGTAVQGVGGVSLLLTDARTGLVQTMVTFTDGSYYMLGVRPGTYRLTVDPRVLDLLRVSAEPREIVVAPAGDGPGAIDVVLSPRP